MKRAGPLVTINTSCFDCSFETSDSYCVEDVNDVDSGHKVYCTHPEAPLAGEARRYIADSCWDTPDWCPLLGTPPGDGKEGERRG